MDRVASAETPELALARWGTRFTSPETEGRYRAWHMEQAVPFNRASVVAAAALWSATVVFLSSLGILLSGVPVIVLVVPQKLHPRIERSIVLQ
jgi:hypothetical protein